MNKSKWINLVALVLITFTLPVNIEKKETFLIVVKSILIVGNFIIILNELLKPKQEGKL